MPALHSRTVIRTFRGQEVAKISARWLTIEPTRARRGFPAPVAPSACRRDFLTRSPVAGLQNGNRAGQFSIEPLSTDAPFGRRKASANSPARILSARIRSIASDGAQNCIPAGWSQWIVLYEYTIFIRTKHKSGGSLRTEASSGSVNATGIAPAGRYAASANEGNRLRPSGGDESDVRGAHQGRCKAR